MCDIIYEEKDRQYVCSKCNIVLGYAAPVNTRYCPMCGRKIGVIKVERKYRGE